jgi:hypothetical protein
VTQLRPAQWRIINSLFLHSMHTVYPKLATVRKNQEAYNGDFLGLAEQGLIAAVIDDGDCPIDPALLRYRANEAALRLTVEGKRRGEVDPLNTVVWKLAATDGKPLGLNKLIDCEAVTHASLCDLQESGVIDVATCDGMPVQLSRTDVGAANQLKARLTERGRSYVAL